MKKSSLFFFIFTIFGVIVSLSFVFGQEDRYAKQFAEEFYDCSFPTKTVLIERGYDYDYIYGGGPSGNGGYPTVVAYMKLSSTLSEKELFHYYNRQDLEVYFDWWVEVEEGKKWYEGVTPTLKKLSDEANNEKPINVIIQKRSSLVTPYGEIVY